VLPWRAWDLEVFEMPRAKSSRRRSPIRVADEKQVTATGKTVPVKPVRRGRAAREPLPEPALDHRRQIIGSDELPKQSRRR
jgi:hypothetical protein